MEILLLNEKTLRMIFVDASLKIAGSSHDLGAPRIVEKPIVRNIRLKIEIYKIKTPKYIA